MTRKRTRTAPGNRDKKAKETKQRGLSTQILFVQGGGKGVHDEWDNKLVASLEQALGPGHTIRYPRMPRESNPDAGAWTRAIARELGKLSEVARDIRLLGERRR
ncbi:MAG TPA: hypothetical protein VH374_24460 [Polyangia bacterium]|jgi:hypothetical protein|nr:hypothetical protein [Polyangia bacterium]